MKVSVLISAALILGCPPIPAQAAAMTIPATTRQVVLAKGDGGRYLWSLVRAPVPSVGDHQILVHVRAVGL